MTVYVDHARNKLGRMIMCHMLADTDEELHAMAAAIGMRRAWHQPRSHSHYDVCLSRRAHALRLGAVEVSRHQLVAIMRRQRAALAAGQPAGQAGGSNTENGSADLGQRQQG